MEEVTRRRPLFAFVFAFSLLPLFHSSSSQRPAPTVILFSIDGWRWDYAGKAPTPNLERFIARGVRAERLIPVFPTKTFPNHYSIVTGLYPEHHGIVGNVAKDPRDGQRFVYSDAEIVAEARWWGGEPVWIALERQGHPTAPLFWPGVTAAIQGVRPRYWRTYDESMPNSARVDQILAWLDLADDGRPRFITGYFSDIDTIGHRSGPDSPALADALRRVDAEIGRLFDGLERRGLSDAVNVVLVSDHGMAPTSPDRIIVLEDYLAAEDADIVDLNPNLGAFAARLSIEEIYRRLAGAHPRLRVFRREDTPRHWRYRDHPMIPPIVGVADEGWTLVRRRPEDAPQRQPGGGSHGYDPALLSMHGLFVAAGPAFRRGVVVPPFENVHVYNALAAALAITPAKNDGDPGVARRLLAR